ncbi:sulfatase-like hydrolase/transferase [Flammeovirga yaeyamensis]|uniref:Sulfatase-like hydrolase/transferase n=1 Tax=Flammeovirga yaeyamensis TaxID=367791 RepID=A0AAX1N461_9BACT|nr:arylsulfatase [Flammeovirga yaeyamensis]MBB3700154.1 arylsulfatase [Flammeovirga yaeyamensis]NMF37216.1 arylsulfatase [Flammeovirga yaeyamensis]QWG00905.1 sulfatase-like hydrolase/transferase [Flammeovirga yaeyamensis]
MKKIYIILPLFLMLFSGCSLLQQKDQINRPNIVLIIADDLGFSDLGIYGSEIQTPNIDLLASSGVQFTNFHAGAACSPTRTMLLTGVDNHLAGLGNMLEIQSENQLGKSGYEGHLNQNVTTIASWLNQSGYHTYMAGKWHLGKIPQTRPYAQGFDQSFALMESGADNWELKSYAPLYQEIHFYENKKRINELPEDYFSSDYFTSKVIEYISKQEDNSPFFAYLSFQAVHMPHQAPKSYIDKYNGVYDKGWEQVRRNRLQKQIENNVVLPSTTLNATFEETTQPNWKLSPWNKLSDREKKYSARQMQTYAGMVDNMDYNIGRLVSYLKETGQYENTIFIFMSDNGADPNDLSKNEAFSKWYKQQYEYVSIDDYDETFSQIGQKGSYSAYGPNWAATANTPTSYFKTFSSEGGMRVPLIISHPKGFKRNKISNEFIYVKDIAPTILEFAQVNIEHQIEDKFEISGISLLDYIHGDKDFVHEETEYIGYELSGSAAIFKGDFKLANNPAPKGDGTWKLFNIKNDPSEQTDLSTYYPQLKAEMLIAFNNYQTENGVIPVPKDYNPIKQLIINSTR